MSPRLLTAIAIATGVAAWATQSPQAGSPRPWVQAGDKGPPPQEIAQESDRKYDPITRMLVRTGRQMHNELPSEGYTF